MPQDPIRIRTDQGNFQRRCHGLDGLSHEHRMQQRWGTPARTLDLRGVRNAAVGALLLSTVLPATAPAASAPIPVPSASTSGLLPGARAMDIEMGAYPSGAPAAEPLLGGLPRQVGNLAADTAAATCALSPRRCGMAMAVGATLTALGTGTLGLAWWLRHGSEPTLPHATPMLPDNAADRGPTAEEIDRLLRPLRFNASELDPAHPPCQSLGAHVNARWQADTALEHSRTRLGTFEYLRDRSLLVRHELAGRIAAMPQPDAAEKVIGDLWSTGMDASRIEADGITPLQPELQAIDALADRNQLLDHLFRSTASARNPLFDFVALPDLEDPAVNIAYLGQGGLGLPDSAWYADPAKSRMLDAYQAYVTQTLQLSGMTTDDAARAADDVIALERALAEGSEPFAVLATEMAQFHNPVNVTQARTHTPTIDWQAFFDAQGMQAPERFSLGMPRFFQRLDALLATTPLHAWKSYLRFHAVDRASPCLSSTFVANHAGFHDVVLKGRRTPVPRWARVLDIIERCAGDAFSPMYTRAVYSSDAAGKMEALTTSMAAALEKRLGSLEWMQESTRLHALQKARRFTVEAGRPSHWKSWEGAGTQRKAFLYDVQAAQAFSHRRNIATAGQPPDASAWKMTAQTADAYLDSPRNRIILPAALLQPPFFDAEGDEALNYGGIGVVLGHEMAHGFDSLGSNFDAEGRMRDWWPQEDRERFDALAARLAHQFSQYQVAGRNIDGNLTLDENLADLGGLSIALDAMRLATAGIPDPMIDGMTREQRFFANFAFSWRQLATPERTELDMETDNHVPASVRADGAPSNMPAFAQAFNCSPGDPMARPSAEQVHFL